MEGEEWRGVHGSDAGRGAKDEGEGACSELEDGHGVEAAAARKVRVRWV